METTKDERPVAKRLRNRNIFEDEEEFGAVVENFFMAEAKRQRRTGNLISENLVSKSSQKNLKFSMYLPQNREMEKMKTKPNNEKTKSFQKKGKETMMKETIKSLPVEILVKIFNFLSNHDIRFGASLACKEFYKICRDESLVPVKDLCINGGKKNEWEWRKFDAVSKIIQKSKDLTFLKINALNPVHVSRLLSIALQSCPKLSQVEIFDTPTKQIDIDQYYRLFSTIKELGKNLSSIELSIAADCNTADDPYDDSMIYSIIKGCPKLKSLTLESVTLKRTTDFDEKLMIITSDGLEALEESCKELKDLKITNVWFKGCLGENDVEKILPDCNVEIKECAYDDWYYFDEDGAPAFY